MARRVTALVPGGLVGQYRVVRELDSRTPAVYAARREHGHELVTLCRYSSRDPAGALLLETQWIAKIASPHIPKTKNLAIGADDIIVTSEFIDGVSLAELGAILGGQLDLGLTLRTLLDVLAGLQAMHEVTDARGAPLGVVHGQLTPSDVIVGLDGTTRIVDVVRTAGKKEHQDAGYLAPEVLLGVGEVDARADVYSVGVLLWEALEGARLFHGNDASAVLAHRLTETIRRPRPALPWAEPLADVALAALAPKADARLPSAARMAMGIVTVAERHVSAPQEVAAAVAALAGERIRARRNHLLARRAMPSASDVRETAPATVSEDDTATAVVDDQRTAVIDGDDEQATSKLETDRDPLKPIDEESVEGATEVDFAFLRSMYLKGQESAPPTPEKVAFEESMSAPSTEPATDGRPAAPAGDDEPEPATVSIVEKTGEDSTLTVDLNAPDVQVADSSVSVTLPQKTKRAGIAPAQHDPPAPSTDPGPAPTPDLQKPIEDDPTDDSLTAQPSPAYAALLDSVREQLEKGKMPSIPPTVGEPQPRTVVVARLPEGATEEGPTVSASLPVATVKRADLDEIHVTSDERTHALPRPPSEPRIPHAPPYFPPANIQQGETLPLDANVLPVPAHVAAQPPPSPAPLQASHADAPQPQAPWPSVQPSMHAVEPALWMQPRLPEQQESTQRRQSSGASGWIVAASVLVGSAGAALIVWVLLTGPDPAPTPNDPRTPQVRVLGLGAPTLQRSGAPSTSAIAPPSASASAASSASASAKPKPKR